MSEARKSWVESANDSACGFPLANLPFCAFQAGNGEQHLAVGIGDSILDLRELARSGQIASLSPELREACEQPTLNALMACGRQKTSQLREVLTWTLSHDARPSTIRAVESMLRPMSTARYGMPVSVGDYTDFYASIYHATNVGKLFRPDQPLMPNYKFVPIGYHGRASSVVISGRNVRRPSGQTKALSADVPTFGPSRHMDYELELGVYVGRGNELGSPIGIDDAEQHMFGVSLVNDWSARDIQAWEYQPLGPFLGKSFATSVSPWVVTMEAIEPYRAPLAARAAGDPEPLDYLRTPKGERQGIDVRLEVSIRSKKMREADVDAVRLSSVNATDLYWSFAQMIAHHTSNGCNLRTGDLLASGTISGPDLDSRGCLLEITRRGAEPLRLPTGEERSFLEDGDEITFTGICEREGLPRIGLGECKGMIVPASLSSRAAG